jgi:phage protein D
MPLSHPNAIITASGRSLTAAEAAVLRIEASLGVLGGHDGAILTVWRGSKLADLAQGDPVELALGEVDDEVDVTAGTVAAISARGSVLEIEILAGTAALSQTYVSKTYLGQSVADVVRDLAAGVDIDEVDASADLSAYAIDDRRPVWSHLCDLAGLVDADLGASDAGALRFVPVSTAMPIRLGAQGDVLAWSVGARTAAPTTAIAAYGAASESGADQWHWLRRAPSASGDGALRVVHGFHTRELADQLARALSARRDRRAIGGTAVLVGRPDLRPGNAIQVSDAPGGDLGALRVVRIDHVLDATRGFTTTVAVEGAGGAGGGLP